MSADDGDNGSAAVLVTSRHAPIHSSVQAPISSYIRFSVYYHRATAWFTTQSTQNMATVIVVRNEHTEMSMFGGMNIYAVLCILWT